MGGNLRAGEDKRKGGGQASVIRIKMTACKTICKRPRHRKLATAGTAYSQTSNRLIGDSFPSLDGGKRMSKDVMGEELPPACILQSRQHDRK